MHQRHADLYNNLMQLTESSEAFYHVDQKIDGADFRIFLYRLASYTDFCKPDALESRGTMFEIRDGIPARLACWPLSKFFNYEENPFTMGLDLSEGNIDYIADKLDGSLISTYYIGNKLYLKTKGSLHSEQAQSATQLLDSQKYSAFKQFLRTFTLMGYTLNCEFTSPANRIVVAYQEPKLTILSARDNRDGEFIPYELLRRTVQAAGLSESIYVVDSHTEKYKTDMRGLIEQMATMTGIEGFVVRLKSGTTFKLKTHAYVSLHKTKDGINAPRNLYEAIVNGASDDLRSLFKTDDWCLNRINTMEQHVFNHYNHVVRIVDELYEQNKDLDRKTYAIKMRETVEPHIFGLLMNKYLGREINYPEFMIKHYDKYKLSEAEMVAVTEE